MDQPTALRALRAQIITNGARLVHAIATSGHPGAHFEAAHVADLVTQRVAEVDAAIGRAVL
jgi:hypothetical protein